MLEPLSPRRTILAPVDLTPVGEPKIPVIAEYARALAADVLVLHVMSQKLLDPAAVLPSEASARTYLDTIAARLKSSGVHADTLLRTGSAAATILDEALARNVALIVIGTNVRPSLPSAVIGSVADTVARGATCPVLLVQPDLSATSSGELRSFHADAERAGMLTQRTLGLRTIEVMRIVGSVGRFKELGIDFRPRKRGRRRLDEQRLATIRTALEDGMHMPAIEVYKLGFGYYVLDGHHRVAAAIQNGQVEIDANVVEFVPAADEQARDLFVARRAFEQATGLTDVGAARPETYAALHATIESFQAEAGLDDLALAARRWHSAVFRPLWQAIRQRQLLPHFPGERTADILARLVAWRAANLENGARLPGWDAALESFAHAIDHVAPLDPAAP